MSSISVREPDFEQLLRVLRCEVPDRPTLFEFFLNDSLYVDVLGGEAPDPGERFYPEKLQTLAYAKLGYDYVTMIGSDMSFPTHTRDTSKASYSMSHGGVITDWPSFEAYRWNDPENCDYSPVERAEEYLPEGMKVIGWGPNGVLENLVSLMGYEDLCLALHDDPDLVRAVADEIGRRLLKHYEILLEFDCVGAVISNDDWGFNTQTLLAPDDLRRYVLPWHKQFVEAAHAKHKPIILHSCGYLADLWEDVIENLGFDAKHSFQDVIQPVEESYEQYGGRIAILGGIDVDFVCRATPKEITVRSRAMLQRAAERGGYALGTGNSVPEWVPFDNYYAMIEAIESW